MQLRSDGHGRGEGTATVALVYMLGSLCFLAASYLAYAEVSHGAASSAAGALCFLVRAYLPTLGLFDTD